jgi:hypothetical protein
LVSWNEIDTLGFFFRHYDPWVDRYVVYDNGSTDGTRELLQAHPRVELRQFERVDADSFVLSHTRLQNNAWKESARTADWVVITAIDEHLHVPGQGMKEYLQDRRRYGVTCIPALGYQMLSREAPRPGERLCETRTMGASYEVMSKLSLFNPTAIEETNYAVGRHAASPSGRIKLPWRDRLLLLHYKYLGYERAFRRECFLKTGLGPTDLANQWGVQYLRNGEEFNQAWQDFERRVEDISCADMRPWKNHPGLRPWRSAWWNRLHRLAQLYRPNATRRGTQ